MSGMEIPLLIAATATSAIGAIKQGQNAKAAGDFNAKVASNRATSARQVAAENARREKRLGMKRQGELRARGMSLDILEDSAMEEELNLLSVKHGGDVAAIGFNTTAQSERRRGETAQTAGYASAAGTVLAGGYKTSRLSGDKDED